MLYSKKDIIDIASDRSEELLDLGDKGILNRLDKVAERCEYFFIIATH